MSEDISFKFVIANYCNCYAALVSETVFYSFH